jgi:hypothetical protein
MQPGKEPMNTIPENTNSIVTRPEVIIDTEPSRCHHRFANGKRCRLPATDSQLGLCLRHFTLHAAANLSLQIAHDDTEDLSADLLGQASGSGSPLVRNNFYRVFFSSSARGASLRVALQSLFISRTRFSIPSLRIAVDFARGPRKPLLAQCFNGPADQLSPSPIPPSRMMAWGFSGQ